MQPFELEISAGDFGLAAGHDDSPTLRLRAVRRRRRLLPEKHLVQLPEIATIQAAAQHVGWNLACILRSSWCPDTKSIDRHQSAQP
jgi:hypothetical protein